jgi:peptidoglycan/LPS O-acetylase OafA/YrhL
MIAVNPNRPYYPALDGLRGLAILLVVLYHNFGFIKQSFFGWLGVDLFFVLSGFLITSILLKELGTPDYLKNFFIRRVLRIFPLYFLCLIIFLILFPVLGLYKKELAFFVKNQWWLWTYLQNWLYSFYLSDDAKMLTHLWSLAVEEQFYLIWPFVILLVKSPRKLFFIMLAVLVLTILLRSIIWLSQIEDLNYTTLYTFTRIDGICIGSMVALLLRFKPKLISKNMTAIVLALAAMNFIFYFINQSDRNSYPYYAFVGYTTFCAMFGLLLHEIVTSNDNTIINKILSIKPLRFLGKISYGFYVYHWPVYIMSQLYFFNSLRDSLNLTDTSSRLGASLLSTGLAFFISVISYNYFERYFLRLKNKFK